MALVPERAWPRLHVVRCSVQPEFLNGALAEVAPSSLQFVCVGRLCREKGQALLVEAARTLADEGHTFRLVFVGDGPSRAELERRVRELKLQEIVSVIGWRSSTQIRDLVAASTALVIASFAEGLPIVAMESLALGRPVIATNIAAISELVEDGVCGWLVPPGSVDHLAGAMKAAAACTPSQLQAMGERGRARVREMHDPQRQADLLRKLIVEAAGELRWH
jgi:glycosyltransferase involved in cell wall biosynthesis